MICNAFHGCEIYGEGKIFYNLFDVHNGAQK
jgi:hypothetical protein